jgi:hypothetical protein
MEVVRHNREDVRSLARLLGRIDADYADPIARRVVPRGDLAGLARLFARDGRLDEALDCLDAGLDRPATDSPSSAPSVGDGDGGADADAGAAQPWWHPKRVADIGGTRRRPTWDRLVAGRLESPWTVERVTIERARLLRRMRRHEEAVATWRDLTGGGGAVAIHAWTEVAKLREHRLGDRPGAIEATRTAMALAERRRRLGMGDPVVERALATRLARLLRRGQREATPELRQAAGADVRPRGGDPGSGSWPR